MARKPLAEYRSGENIDDVFLLARNELRSTRTGALYLDLLISDHSGTLPGRLWDATEALHRALSVDDFVRVKGKAETYRNTLQIKVGSIVKVEPSEINLEEFLPRSRHDPDAMLKELRGLMDGIEDADYRRVVDAFLDDASFCEAFKRAPAATQYHHAYLGGLLEHTLSMGRMVLRVAEHYEELRKDLLLAAVLLHDMGKIRELGYERTFKYTDEGQLIGHLVIGVMMLEEKLPELESVPPEKMDLLRHLLLSHHGEFEYGSPKQPMVIEAFVLHYLDNLDAKIQEFSWRIEEDRSENSDWTEYIHRYGRRLYKG